MAPNLKWFGIVFLIAATGFRTPALSQTGADSVMTQRTLELIGSHAQDIRYNDTRTALLCDILWLPLSDGGLTELEYDNNYPYRFAEYVFKNTQIPKIIYKKKIKGLAEVKFEIDTSGLLALQSIEFQQYKNPRGETTPVIEESLRQEVLQNLRSCIENAAAWTPICDIAGNKYPCQCSMFIEIGQQQIVHQVLIQFSLNEKYMPLLEDESGKPMPRHLILRKNYDERHEPQLRDAEKRKKLEKENQLVKDVYKAAGIR